MIDGTTHRLNVPRCDMAWWIKLYLHLSDFAGYLRHFLQITLFQFYVFIFIFCFVVAVCGFPVEKCQSQRWGLIACVCVRFEWLNVWWIIFRRSHDIPNNGLANCFDWTDHLKGGRHRLPSARSYVPAELKLKPFKRSFGRNRIVHHDHDGNIFGVVLLLLRLPLSLSSLIGSSLVCIASTLSSLFTMKNLLNRYVITQEEEAGRTLGCRCSAYHFRQQHQPISVLGLAAVRHTSHRGTRGSRANPRARTSAVP